MRAQILSITTALLVAVFSLTALAVQEPQPSTGKKVGEKVQEALKEVKKGAQDVSESVREQFAKVRASVHNMEIEARIYSRLHWDKALNAATIDLEVHSGGIVTLRGAVADAGARQKAVALARDTVGVSQVIDQLTISQPTGTPASSGGAKPSAPKQ